MEYCNYTTLHHCEHGYVVVCKNCNTYQIAFGNLILNLNQIEYQALLTYLQKEYSSNVGEWQQRKLIQIPSDSTKISMIFSLEEVQLLTDMLQQARMLDLVYETLKNEN